MPRIVYLSVIVAALVVLAVGGWTVQGVSRLVAAARPHGRPRLAASG